MASEIGILNDIRLYDNSSAELHPSLCRGHEQDAQRELINTVNNLYYRCNTFKTFCDTNLNSSNGHQNSIFISERNVTIKTESGYKNLIFSELDNEADKNQLLSESSHLLEKINRIYADCMSDTESADDFSDNGISTRHQDIRPMQETHHHYYYGKNLRGDSYTHQRGRSHRRKSHRHQPCSGESRTHRRREAPDSLSRSGQVKKVESTVTPRSLEGVSDAVLRNESLRNLEHCMNLANLLDAGTVPNEFKEQFPILLHDLKRDHRTKHDQLCHHMYSLYKHKIGQEPANEAERWNIGRELFIGSQYRGIEVTDKDKALATRLMILDQLKPYYIDSKTPRDSLNALYSKLPHEMRNKIEGHAWQKSKAYRDVEAKYQAANKGKNRQKIGKLIMSGGVEVDDKYYLQVGAIEDYIRDHLLARSRTA
jgi:hypothetical protein